MDIFAIVGAMAVPKQHRSSSRRDQRRMHLFLKNPGLVLCKKCSKKIVPHMVCPYCGIYQGRQVVDVLSQLAKKEKKDKLRNTK